MKVFIQNEAGSFIKHIHDEKSLTPNRTTVVSRSYLFPYGFVLDTTAAGLNVDCFVLTNQSLRTGEIIDCVPIALMEQIEDTQEDHNVLAVIPGEPVHLDAQIQQTLSDFVTHVFDHIPGKKIRPGKFLNRGAALAYLRAHQDSPVADTE